MWFSRLPHGGLRPVPSPSRASLVAMHWVLLSIAILFEIAGTTSMKLSDGLTRLWPTIAIFVCYGIAFVFLTLSLKRLDIGVAYAIWSGVGTALIAIIGFLFFKETATLMKVASIGLIILGVIGLKLGQ